uniref:Transmembrane protein 254 n=1 Tax=Capra hircus TaxID=9925 RepID=A0A452DJR8_CAPHI
MGKARGDEAYFQRSSLFCVTVIILSFGYYTWVLFWPESVPYQSLGPLGPFTQYLLKHYHTLMHGCYWLAWMIHVGESLYAIGTVLMFLKSFIYGLTCCSVSFSSVQFSRSVVSDSLRPDESQHARPPCPSPSPGVHSDSRPSSQ